MSSVKGTLTYELFLGKFSSVRKKESLGKCLILSFGIVLLNEDVIRGMKV